MKLQDGKRCFSNKAEYRHAMQQQRHWPKALAIQHWDWRRRLWRWQHWRQQWCQHSRSRATAAVDRIPSLPHSSQKPGRPTQGRGPAIASPPRLTLLSSQLASGNRTVGDMLAQDRSPFARPVPKVTTTFARRQQTVLFVVRSSRFKTIPSPVALACKCEN